MTEPVAGSRTAATGNRRVVVAVPVRWADIDAYGHVNNAAVATILEEARIAVLWAGGDGMPRIDGGLDGGTVTLVARLEIEYLAPLPYTMQPVYVAMWVAHVGGTSLDIAYEVGPEPEGEVAVRAVTTIALTDRTSGRPRRLTPAEREGFEAYLGEPPAFRRRR